MPLSELLRSGEVSDPEPVFTLARLRVARQQKLVRKLMAEGKDTRTARRLLETYEELLQILSRPIGDSPAAVRRDQSED
jgi:hypothetical protein